MEAELQKARERIGQLEERLREAWALIEKLEQENRELQKLLEEAQRRTARQAAPFRREQKKKIPDAEKKRPGRKPGHPGVCRAVPEHVDEEVEVPLSACPKCNGTLQGVTRLEQYIEEIPPIRPRVTKLVTYCGECPGCGEVRSTHPLQTSVGQGAAKVQLGPRALALSAFLNKRLGVSMRNTCRVLKAFGLSFSAGGLSQALVRMSGRVGEWHETLASDLRQSAAVFSDETSWWVGGPGWWLWTFTTPETTLYKVAQSRGSQVVREMLGDDFSGVLVSDCLATYDPLAYRKHKCIAHHQRAIAEASARPDTSDPVYLNTWKGIFKAVIALWNSRPQMSPSSFVEERGRIVGAVERLLNQPVRQPGDVAIQNRLLKQRGHLLTCLSDPAAEPTNNRAERALRPAVIARKISCGNRTDRGRQCWEILTSLAQTCHQRSLNFLEELASRLPLNPRAG